MSNSNIKILHGQRQEKKGLQVHHNIARYRNWNVSSGLEVKCHSSVISEWLYLDSTHSLFFISVIFGGLEKIGEENEREKYFLLLGRLENREDRKWDGPQNLIPPK